MNLDSKARLWWRRLFCWYGPLSLSTMAGMSIGGALLLLGTFWTLARSWKNGARESVAEVFRHPLLWATLALFLVSLASLVWAWISPPLGEPASGVAELKKFHHFLYPPLVALAFLYTADKFEQHPFWRYWAGMGIFCGVLAVLQFFGRDIFPEAWLSHRFFRPVGETGRFHGQGLMFFHLSFASCLSFVASTGIARLLWPQSWDGKGDRIFWSLVSVAGIASVFFSYSRIAFFGLGVVIVFLFFLRKPWLGSLVAAIVVATAALLWVGSPTIRDRFETTGGGNKERRLMWEASWQMFQDRPVVGFGFARSGRYTPVYARNILGSRPWFTSHAHNNFLDALAATGILGLLAYLAWWGTLFVSAWRSFRASADKWLPGAALGGLLAFQVNGLTQVNFWDGKSQHTLMLWAGLVLALSVRRRREEGKPLRS